MSHITVRRLSFFQGYYLAKDVETLLVEELIVSADFQEVVVYVHVIQIILSVTQSLIDQQVHSGRTSNTERHRALHHHRSNIVHTIMQRWGAKN